MKKLIPVNGHILVRPCKAETEKDLGNGKKIVFAEVHADNVKQRADRGEVLEVADDVKWVSVGDDVFLYPFAKNEVNVDGEDLIMVNKEDVMGVWREG